MTNQQTGWNLENSYFELPDIFYVETKPTPVKDPDIVVLNRELAESIGLKTSSIQNDDGLFTGNKQPPGSRPLSQAYAGHQFGHFTRLGDGRAVLLGEQVTPDGERYDIQFKGSGKTPFSRGGDGRAGLGPMLREYIISEAMHALGIPTTRSLAVTKTGETIFREDMLEGAVLTRVASSHIRVGTFQYAAAWGTKEELKALADYTIQRHDPEIKEDNNPYLSLLKKVIDRQASLIAKWQLVGFIHGVMNTDNMTISGETIDYGPCAFMDKYDPATVFSSIDHQGRYAYRNQPDIGGWNLIRFAETLVPLIDEDEEKAIELAKTTLRTYKDVFKEAWLSGMRLKLGIVNEEVDDQRLIDDLLNIMKKDKLDYTNTFVSLTNGDDPAVNRSDAYKDWHIQWMDRLKRQEQTPREVKNIMKENNPLVIPRNHLVEEALEAAVEHEDYEVMERLLHVLEKPYAYTDEQKEYTTVPKSPVPYQTFCGT